MLFLLIAFCQVEQEPEAVDTRVFEIVLGVDADSKQMESELTRDWHAKGISASSEKMRELQFRVKRHLVLSCDRLRTHPAWRYGGYGPFIEFDKRTFNDSGRPLIVIDTLIENCLMDLKCWKTECESVTYSAENAWATKFMAWVGDEERKKFGHTVTEWGTPDNAWFLRVQSHFRGWDAGPVYIEPELPKCPLRKMPWE